MIDLRAVVSTAALVAVVIGVTACSSGDADARPSRVSASPAPSPTPLPLLAGKLSLPALMQQEFRPSRIRQVEELGRNPQFIRSRITYRSGDLTVSGLLLRPRGAGPFPGVVLNHGYIDPSLYLNGQGMRREQEKLLRAGFVVLHVDYRGHAGSDDFTDPFDQASRVGYAQDSIHAVLALQQESYVDPDRMAMFGKSMGGAVTLNALVAQPGLVKAAVIYSSMSSQFAENLEHFASREDLREFYGAVGLPHQTPDFYTQLSPRTYFDRVTAPILLHHGRQDRVCPYRWSVATQRALAEDGVDAELISWADEDHAFDAGWEESMDRSIEFLLDHL